MFILIFNLTNFSNTNKWKENLTHFFLNLVSSLILLQVRLIHYCCCNNALKLQQFYLCFGDGVKKENRWKIKTHQSTNPTVETAEHMMWAWVLNHLPACPSYLCVEFCLNDKLFHSFCTGLLGKAYSLPDITTLVSDWIILPGPHCLQSIDSDPSPSRQLHCMHTQREGRQKNKKK